MTDKQIVKLLNDGLTPAQIASIYNFTTRYVQIRVKNLRERYDCKTNAQLVAHFLKKEVNLYDK